MSLLAKKSKTPFSYYELDLSNPVESWITEFKFYRVYCDFENTGRLWKALMKIKFIKYRFFRARVHPLICTFTRGYCYYFSACIQSAFDRGEKVLLFPYDHIAWRDQDGEIYDIGGRLKKDPLTNDAGFVCIPESEWTDLVKGRFKAQQVDWDSDDDFRNDLIQVYKKYCCAMGVDELDKVDLSAIIERLK